MLSHSLPLSMDLDAKLIETDFHIKELLSLGETEMNEFLDFVKDDLVEHKGTTHITSAKQKFDLKLIKRHSSLFSKIFTYSTTALGIIISAMILIATIKAFRKYRYQQRLNQQPTIKINFQGLTEKTSSFTETENQLESEGELKAEEFVTLRG